MIGICRASSMTAAACISSNRAITAGSASVQRTLYSTSACRVCSCRGSSVVAGASVARGSARSSMSVSGNERVVSKRGPAQYVLIETWDAGSAGGPNYTCY